MTTPAELAGRLNEEAERVESEVSEIELLVGQARTEAARHETRRAAVAEKLAQAAANNKDLSDLAKQVVTLSRRAALMEAQIDLLEAKRKALTRLQQTIQEHAVAVGALGVRADTGGPREAAAREASRMSASVGLPDLVTEGMAVPPSVSRLILAAQEDLRREIARSMHDGPAQSLTNIVLQAQIVDRLLAKDPNAARAEVQQLVGMVQRTLESTKTFIFDVRPMVLDDLGLVPTLRRSARDRGRRAGVRVQFESVGVDRRLTPELESGLFRILDEALAAHIAGKPETLSLRMDWHDTDLDVEMTAGRTPPAPDAPQMPNAGEDMPPALREMVEERQAAQRAATEAARIAALARLPDNVWRDLSARADLLGITAELLDEGARLRLAVRVPAATPEVVPS
jgi:two-component system sensor histidine kinase DegS